MSLKLKKRGAIWYVRGTLRGQYVYASTKETDKAAAGRFKEQLEDRIIRAGSLQRHDITFSRAADLYVEYRRPSRADAGFIRRIVALLGDQLIGDIRQHIVVETANALYDGLSPATKNRNVVGPVAAVIHYAAENELCPYIKIRKFKEKRAEPRWLSQEDAERLIAASAGDMRRLLIFLFCQGWRISDALALRWENIDWSAGSVRYHVKKLDEWRTIPLHGRVLTMLGPLKQDVGAVFPWSDRSSVYRPLRKLCKACGVAFTPHRARHSFATWLVNDGATLPDVMEAGGWLDHKSVLRYARLNQERVRSTINRIKA